MKKVVFCFIVALFQAISSSAAPLYPDSETAASEVELGVEGIQRICPTGMWDHWTFRDIKFDRESNSVALYIQLRSWSERQEEKAGQVTAEELTKQGGWILQNFKKGYDGLIKNPAVRCDGDLMLYLSLGTLFKQMEKDGVNLQLVILKPDGKTSAFGDRRIDFSPQQLREVTEK